MIPDCEVLVDTGNLRCDLYLPVRDIVKLQLQPLDATKLAQPVDTQPIRIRQFESVEITMSFADAEGKQHLRKVSCQLEAEPRLQSSLFFCSQSLSLSLSHSASRRCSKCSATTRSTRSSR